MYYQLTRARVRTLASSAMMSDASPPVALSDDQSQVPVQWPQSTPTTGYLPVVVTVVVAPVKLMSLKYKVSNS